MEPISMNTGKGGIIKRRRGSMTSMGGKNSGLATRPGRRRGPATVRRGCFAQYVARAGNKPDTFAI